jgi:glucokinase
MATVGEWKFGAGLGSDDIVMVTVGTGIGTSVVIEGKLLRGKHYQAGCLGGHFTVNYSGKQCSCGNIGCVEAEAATWNLAALARNHPNYSNSALSKEEIIDFAALFKLAKSGDLIANEIKLHCLNVWTAGIISYIHAYDPEKVILGGGILKSQAEIVPYIQDKVDKHAWTPWGKVAIIASSLDDSAAIVGATFSLQNNI